MYFTFAIIFVLKLTSANSQNLDSPCPRLFVYEPRQETDKWYGIVTLLSDSELSGVWLRLILDRPALQLGNWFGEVVTTDNKEFLIRKTTHKLSKNTPYPLRFFIKYDPSEKIPEIVEIRLNARTFCPEGLTTSTSTTEAQLITSGLLSSTIKTSTINTSTIKTSTTEEIPFGLIDETSKETLFIRPQIFEGDKPDPNVFGVNDTELEGEECGIISPSPLPIISYGTKPFLGEFPWHVAIYHSFGGGLEYACGGSLISRFHVLTAGHCVTNSQHKILDVEQVVVHLGKDNLKEWSSSRYQLREVKEINRHPQYNNQLFKNDIAILKLTSAAIYTNTVRPVCLWEKEEDSDELTGKIGLIAGFGYNERGEVSHQLIKTKMPIIKQTTCIFTFPNFYSRFSSQNTFCAGFKNGTTVCNGDSGGGLVFPKIVGEPPKKIYFLRGVASIILLPSNADDNRKCHPEYYPIFADVAKHLDFIRKCMRD